MIAAVIHADGLVLVDDYPVNPAWIREVIGGWMEMIQLSNGSGSMLVDEEARSKDHQLPNLVATAIMEVSGPFDPQGFILGNAIIIGNDGSNFKDLGGSWVSLLDKVAAATPPNWDDLVIREAEVSWEVCRVRLEGKLEPISTKRTLQSAHQEAERSRSPLQKIWKQRPDGGYVRLSSGLTYH